MNHSTENNPATKSRPAEEIRLGAIKAAIWKNETEAGTRYNVTFERLYRQDEEWKSTSSFGRDDLLLLAKAADQTHSWILTASREPMASPEAQGQDEPLSGAALPKAPASRRKG